MRHMLLPSLRLTDPPNVALRPAGRCIGLGDAPWKGWGHLTGPAPLRDHFVGSGQERSGMVRLRSAVTCACHRASRCATLCGQSTADETSKSLSA
jgi:hypothetical protein